MKHCKPDITVYRVIAAVTKLERAWNLALVLQIVQKNSQKYFPCLYLSIDQVWWVNESWIFSKMLPVSCTNTHHDVTHLVNHGMVKDTKS